MLFRKGGDIPSSEITPQKHYVNRRQFMIAAGAAVAGVGLALYGGRRLLTPDEVVLAGQKLPGVIKGPFGTDEKQTPYKDITTYNNFYEFGTDKSDPSQNAGTLRTRPWTVKVEGNCAKPKIWDVDELMKLATLEDRVYRLRCVEGWSMVIPWVGFPLKALIDRSEPTSKAKFMEFTTLHDPTQMPGQKSSVLQWPYVEGLRMDEALHPLAILCFGLYGEVLPNQDGAPVRIVAPWKYGFKSGKSLVRIRFVENMPATTWNIAAPNEYGFYSNVNPNVDHPRWSQAKERRIGEFFKRPTLMFNGYGDQVASMYNGMDLKKWF